MLQRPVSFAGADLKLVCFQLSKLFLDDTELLLPSLGIRVFIFTTEVVIGRCLSFTREGNGGVL